MFTEELRLCVLQSGFMLQFHLLRAFDFVFRECRAVISKRYFYIGKNVKVSSESDPQRSMDDNC